VLVEQPERALLRLVALARQVLERLAARRLLAAAYNPSVLVLHEVGLLQATRRVLRGTVPNHSLCANGRYIVGHLILLTAVLFRMASSQKLEGGGRGPTSHQNDYDVHS
jgi:hypothetical protein